MTEFKEGDIIAVISMPSHGLHWTEENPAFARVLSGRRFEFITAPPTWWCERAPSHVYEWDKNAPFPLERSPPLIARLATEDEIAVALMKQALMPDPLPDRDEP